MNPHVPTPVDTKPLARHFGRATKKRVTEGTEILDTLVLMGQAKQQGDLAIAVR